MHEVPPISRVRFSAAPLALSQAGLLGFASCAVGDLGRLDGLVVRRVGPEMYSVAFPARRDQSGRRHPYFAPSNRTIREVIERGVIDALRARGILP